MSRTSNPAGSPRVTGLTSKASSVQARDQGEMQRFEDLSRKLLQVPKATVDSKRGKIGKI